MKFRKPTLKSVDFFAKRGSLIAIVGQVGSGKTSLLQLILRELPLKKGSIDLDGNIAYVSQDPWIFSSSIRQNIIYTKPMDKNRYGTVIKVCQLQRDFSLFPYKDLTLIGEKGINLSGGQRARIGLARAVYADADIYLLDDPHQLQYLKNVDQVYIIDEGTVQKKGSCENLQDHRLDFLNKVNTDEEQKDTEKKLDFAVRIQSSEGDFDTQNITSDQKQKAHDEDKTTGQTALSLYISYLKAGSHWITFFGFLLLIILEAAKVGADYLVVVWANSRGSWSEISNFKKGCFNSIEDSRWYISVHRGLIFILGITSCLYEFLYSEKCKRSSQRLHSLIFRNIIRGGMSFFYKNTPGRIMNRYDCNLIRMLY